MESRRYILFVLTFVAVVAMFPNSVLFPAEADIAKHLHASISLVGWMISVYAIAYIISTPFLGMLSDYVGRKGVLFLGLIAFAAGGMVPLWSGSETLILSGRALMGVGAAGLMPMVDSLIGDLYDRGPDRKRAFAAFGAAIAVAEALVPFLGGVVDVWTWKAVFALYGLSLIGAALAAAIQPPSRHHEEARMDFKSYLASFRVAMSMRSLLTSNITAAGFGVVYFGVCALLPYALTHHSGLKSGTLFLPLGVTWVLGSAWLAKKAHATNAHSVTLLSGLLLAASTVVMSFTHTFSWLLVLCALWGLGSAFMTMMLTWTIGEDTPDPVRGAMNGIFNASYVLGFSIGAPVFLSLFSRFGYLTTMWVAAILMAVLSVYSYWGLRLKDYSHVPSEFTHSH